MNSEIIRQEFEIRFGKPAVFVRSPARINIIGEHTDYNEGFVLPATVDYVMFFAFGISQSNKSTIIAHDLGEELRFDFLSEPFKRDNWLDYLLGIIGQLQNRGLNIGNINCVFGGNIPIGAGMSSSAAITTGFLYGLNQLFSLELSNKDMALIAQAAEQDFVGVNCGIMDQFAILNGQSGSALLLDCRSLDYQLVPIEFEKYQWVLCNTGVSHSLADSAYNARRHECEQGVILLNDEFPAINALRDADLGQIEGLKDKMTEKTYQHCRFVIEENERVHLAAKAAASGQVELLGELLLQSHKGLKNDYEVSCAELDFLVDQASKTEGVAGARMMGGGFGGCTINLVRKDLLGDFRESMQKAYHTEFKIDLKIYQPRLINGIALIT